MNRDTFEFMDDQKHERGRLGDVRPGLVDLSLALHHETPSRGGDTGAIRVSKDGDDSRAQWIPKILCKNIERHNSFIRGRRKDGSSVGCKSVTVTLPEYVAKEKGLV